MKRMVTPLGAILGTTAFFALPTDGRTSGSPHDPRVHRPCNEGHYGAPGTGMKRTVRSPADLGAGTSVVEDVSVYPGGGGIKGDHYPDGAVREDEFGVAAT